MPTFTYEGRTRAGESAKGEIAARTEEEAIAKLQAQSITGAKVKAKKKKKGFDLSKLMAGKVPPKQIVIFVRQFATMIDAGLPLVQCLELLGQQEPHKGFQRIIFEVKAEVESGSTLADALSKHPKTFDDLFVNLIAAGEVGGILDTILNRLANYMEKAMKLKQKVKGAMKYPVTVLVVSL